MRTRSLIKLVFAVATLFLGLATQQTHAATLSLSPAAGTVQVGAPAVVELNISGLGDFAPDSLGAFLVEIEFDPAVLDIDVSDVMYGSLLGDTDPSAFETDIVTTVEAGRVSLSAASLLLDFELDALQPSSFTLATLTFATLANGTSALSFGTVDLSNAMFPASTLALDSVLTASVTAVPLPAAWLLFLTGLAVLSARRRMTY
ncbi:MAG: hypothetical protein KDK91_19205 [Gammaproteobacteria bacterium]|nr:hypothetical protein [Gammaproteobacteria bacterium]